jgi:hypothetical protein
MMTPTADEAGPEPERAVERVVKIIIMRDTPYIYYQPGSIEVVYSFTPEFVTEKAKKELTDDGAGTGTNF